MKKQKMFNIYAPNKSTRIVEGEASGVLNWDDIRIPELYKLYRVLLGNHWIPDEISMKEDQRQFPELSQAERIAFEKIISLLAVLDSMQTRYLGRLVEYFTDPACEAIAAIIGQQEVVHNQSYSYVLSSLVDWQKQKEIFEHWKHDPVLLERNLFISETYQKFDDDKNPKTFLESVVADMILEGIFFYAGFAFFYNLARQGKMLGTSQMISYIQRDEQHHCYFFGLVYQQLLKDFPELDNPDTVEMTYKMIDKAVELETKWAYHLLSEVEGIDLEDFTNYIKHIANRRLKMFGLEPIYENVHNALPWIKPFVDESLNATKSDFFEAKPRTYAKTSIDNGFDDL